MGAFIVALSLRHIYKKSFAYILINISLEVWPTKAKERPSPHEVRLTTMDINLVF